MNREENLMETIAEIESEREADRRENPRCVNCNAFYVEYGDECCKCYGVPMVRSDRDRCSKWR